MEEGNLTFCNVGLQEARSRKMATLPVTYGPGSASHRGVGGAHNLLQRLRREVGANAGANVLSLLQELGDEVEAYEVSFYTGSLLPRRYSRLMILG